MAQKCKNIQKLPTHISQFIESQFPSIYQQEGEGIVLFMKAYYEFMEQNYKLNYEMLDIMDIDKTLMEFVDHFKSVYLMDFPYATVCDKRFEIKNIVEYYRRKGTPASLEFLMKLVFKEDISVYEPGLDILKVSDSTWRKPPYLEVTPSKRNVTMIDRQVIGSISGATAFVESVVRKRINGKIIDVMYLSSLQGNFVINEHVIENSNRSLDDAPVILGSLLSVDITLGGRNNAIGDTFNVVTDMGVQGQVKVDEVINATGRVDFYIQDGGWGYDGESDVYVSSAMLFVDNQNEDFIQLERVSQPIETIQILSAENFLDKSLIGQAVKGLDSNNIVLATGTIVAAANLDISWNATNGASDRGVISVQPDMNGASPFSFLFANEIELDRNATFMGGETIQEGSDYTFSLTSISGTFLPNEQIEQIVTKTFGISKTESVSYTNNSEFISILTTGMVIGQEITSTAVPTGTTIKNIVSDSILEMSNKATVTGSVATTIDVLEQIVSKFVGTVDSYTSPSISLIDSFGQPEISGSIIMGLTSGATGIPVNIQDFMAGASGTITNVNAEKIMVKVDSGVFNPGSKLRQVNSSIEYDIVAVTDKGVATLELESDTSTSIAYLTQSAYVSGIVVGQNDERLGLYGNTSPFFFNEDLYSSYVFTNRQKMVSPPKDQFGNIIEVVRTINRVGGGTGANFEVGILSEIETNPVYLDYIEDENIGGVPYLDIKINGQGSGIGYVPNVTITTAGTGYANNAILTFAGGGIGGGNPIVAASGTIKTNGSGAITSITMTHHGEGYINAPIITLPSPGSGAVLTPNMTYGIGFPKNPQGDHTTLLQDLLDFKMADLGSIQSLKRINPGTEYTVDPFIMVRNKYVAPLMRHDLILQLTSMSGSFFPNELVIQVVGGNNVIKGRVRRIETIEGITYLYLKRITLGISIDDSLPIKGFESGQTAMVGNIMEDTSREPIGLNADIYGEVISAEGIATKMSIVKSGFGYSQGDLVTLESVDKNNPFVITGTAVTHGSGITEGHWSDNTSHLNSDKMIHDNDYYQEYSYDVKTGLSIEMYETIVKRLFHVAGTKMFTTFMKQINVDMKIDVIDSVLDEI